MESKLFEDATILSFLIYVIVPLTVRHFFFFHRS